MTLANNKSGDKDDARARSILRHLGTLRATELTVADVERYRRARREERTRRGNAPSPALLDREVALLKRICSYSAKARLIAHNPLAGVPMLNVPNARSRTVNDEQFERLRNAAPPDLRVVMTVAFDTGMRRTEILKLQWSQVDLRQQAIRLGPQDTKTERGRVIILTRRVVAALRGRPRQLRSPYVFASPDGKPWRDIPKAAWRKALVAADLEGLWFHDLRRSFVTNARRKGVAEGVIMRMTGHRTRSVFDRYNIIAEDDLREAVRRLEQATQCVGEDLDEVASQSDEG